VDAKNPARGPDPKRREKPTKPKRKHVYLDHEAVARLAGESGDHRALVLTLAYTGIRWGEAVALRVRHVDEVRRRLLVTDNAVQLGVDPAVGDPKDDEPREVPVPKFLMTELKDQIRGLGADDLVFGQRRRLLAAAEARRRMVCGCGETCQGSADHSTRSEAHSGQLGDQRRGERTGGQPNAGPREPPGDLAVPTPTCSTPT
jgi:integrase